LYLRDCEIYGAGATWIMNESSTTPIVGLTNNVFHRLPFSISNNATINAYNNLFYGTTNSPGNVTNTWVSLRHRGGGSTNFVVRNNVFDGVTNSLDGTLGYNGYLHGATNTGVQGTDITNVTLTWVAGPLGAYYQTNTSPLIKAGILTAAQLGLYHYTVETNMINGLEIPEGDNEVSIGYHYIAVDAYGNPLDSNGDGLPDYVKDLNGDGIYEPGTDPANWLSPFNLYDQGTSFMGWDPPYVRLGYWKFDNTNNWPNQAAIPNLSSSYVYPSNSFSGTAVSLTSTNSQLIYPVSTNGTNLFNPANGTISFWFQPNWSTGSSSEPSSPILFSAAQGNFDWELIHEKKLDTNGSYIDSVMSFFTQSNQYQQPWSFSDNGNNGVVVNFTSNLWYQIVFTYSPTNMALYTNGALLATGNTPPWLCTNISGGWNDLYALFGYGSGNIFSPSASYLTSGFSLGNWDTGNHTVMGQLDELQTFNFAQTAQQVAAGFPYFGGNATSMVDTHYVGRSDMLQSYVDGTWPSTNNVVPCRLGYWRFDSPLLYGEQGQVPLSSSNASVTPSWSGTALVISNGSSQVTYPDVGSNGWANINCRQGSLRFWFKFNGSAPAYSAPFVYLGGSNGTKDEWTLEYTSSNTISFVTQTNEMGLNTVLSPSASCLSATKWTQIVLNYGPTNCALYTNGVLATNSPGNTIWPSAANRQLGMVIGNDTLHDSPINAQFEEMETFNYQLAPSDIAANFQIVTNVDSDLNGIPDYLEDIQLTKSRPFLGAPVVITGTIEAEQFDMGGPGKGYSTTNTALNTIYRPTKMIITNCNDPAGYCLDQMHSNDWTAYSINVLVPQLYMVEVRAQAIGTSTGGIFQCTFTNGAAGLLTNGGFSNSTPPLTITSTNWTDITNVVYLPNGQNVMKLQCLTNAANGTVGRFNYISIYPWWPPPTSGTGTPQNVSLYTGTNYATALSNAVAIQNALTALGSAGGTVTITNANGTFMFAQANPSELSDAYQNAAVSILVNNVEIKGQGEAYTKLVAYNRVTTIFSLGLNPQTNQAQCSNFTISDMTIEGQPHEAVTNTSSVAFVSDPLIPVGEAGALVIAYGLLNTSNFAHNILVTSCLFSNYDRAIVIYPPVSNVMVQACSFVPTGGLDTHGYSNLYTPQPNSFIETGIYGVGGTGSNYNFVVIGNTFNGNCSIALTNTNSSSPATQQDFVNTTNGWFGPDGFAWFQSTANAFLARNFITNNALEAFQMSEGPTSVVGNTFYTLINDYSSCALNGALGPAQYYGVNNSTTFIGNWVYGERHGALLVASTTNGSASPLLTVSGNWLNLSPPLSMTNDSPGSAATLQICQQANVFGNTLVAGGHGVLFASDCANAVILNNNFAGAAYRGIGYATMGDSLTTAQVFGNTLTEGVSFHIQVPCSNSFGWFIGSNTYVTNISIRVPLFIDPTSSAIHIYN
jgi:hypothetical protein